MEYNLNTLSKIIKLGRFKYLLGDFLLFTMGALLAILLNAEFVLSKFVLGYAILFTAHLSVHYSNDYFDSNVDQHTSPTVISGGSGILVDNPELKEFAKWFSIIIMSISIILTAVFTVIFKYPITFFLFLLFGNMLAWFYTAPPIKLSYRRLGEVANIIAVVIFLGTGYFALQRTLDLSFFLFSIPIIFLNLVFIVSFQIPDMEGDKLGGKITWIVLKGREFGFKIIAISGLLATISFLILPFTNMFPLRIDFHVLALISLISLSLGIIGMIKRPVNRESATKLAIINVAALFIISILIDLYFIKLIH
ncbi:prenyltransferase [Methanobacterium spitsbergense]|uniref:Prenyltransferase n=1 Tax=Methanobacterium spitsbergense TaxID=2874285 RepID=A0A8T5UV57_9EURY|nr:prenyltransferase [Methanobacterium spitsbergense]MBZ2164539.1 prenyltransferase [Methanobacterium spitsbergense]